MESLLFNAVKKTGGNSLGLTPVFCVHKFFYYFFDFGVKTLYNFSVVKYNDSALIL